MAPANRHCVCFQGDRGKPGPVGPPGELGEKVSWHTDLHSHRHVVLLCVGDAITAEFSCREPRDLRGQEGSQEMR